MPHVNKFSTLNELKTKGLKQPANSLSNTQRDHIRFQNSGSNFSDQEPIHFPIIKNKFTVESQIETARNSFDFQKLSARSVSRLNNKHQEDTTRVEANSKI